MNVYLTVDVEFWPDSWAQLRLEDIKIALDKYIYGKTNNGEFGLAYQLEVLAKHDLKASYFVESLAVSRLGISILEEIVEQIVTSKQSVQLHLHTEWVDKLMPPIIEGVSGINIRDFSFEDQCKLIELGMSNLKAVGVNDIVAFRAGSYGANFDTLRALRTQGIEYDTSYNYPYLSTSCGLDLGEKIFQPVRMEDVWEFPIAFYEELPGKHRHVQLTACSYGELKHLLFQAYHSGWDSFVIVMHSSELLNQKKMRADPIVIKRFEKLCQLLANHREIFTTSLFSRGEGWRQSSKEVRPLASNVLRTSFRYAEQAYRRIVIS